MHSDNGKKVPMSPKTHVKAFFVILLGIALLAQGCTATGPSVPSAEARTATVTLLPTITPRPATTATAFLTPTVTLTPVPPGVFILFFYDPLVMNYDPSLWVDKSNYGQWGENQSPREGVLIENYLQARDLASCTIGVQGPTDFQQATPEKVQLGDVGYQVITFRENNSVMAFYIEDQSLSRYNYEPGLPIPVIGASSAEWHACKAMAEKVLATLHVP